MNTKTIWIHLLWKEYRQVRPMATMVVVGTIGIQLLLLLLITSLDFSVSESRASVVWSMVFVSPTFAAIACAGMFIGQERQSGTWNWASSLPVSWTTSLLVKLSMSLVTIAVVCVTMAVSAMLLNVMCGDTLPTEMQSTLGIAISIVIALEVLVVMYLGLLLGREPLLSILIASVIFLPAQWMLTAYLIPFTARLLYGEWWHRNGIGIDNFVIHDLYLFHDQFQATTIVGLNIAFSMALVLVGVVLVYRWRWSLGQNAGLSSLLAIPWRGVQCQSQVSSRHRTLKPMSKPTSMMTLIVQSTRQFLLFRVLVVMSVVMGAILSSGAYDQTLNDSDGLTTFVYMWSIPAVFLFGISTFAGETALNRFRFLSDRGIHPWKICFTRLLPPLIVVVVFASIADVLMYLRPNEIPGRIEPFLVYLPLFAVASLSALCTRNAVIGCSLALVTSIAAVYLVAMAHVLPSRGPELILIWALFDWNIGIWLGTATLVLFAGCFWITRRWLIEDRPRMAMGFLKVVVCAFLVATCVALPTGFLRIPFASMPSPSLKAEQASSVHRMIHVPNATGYDKIRMVQLALQIADRDEAASIWNEMVRFPNDRYPDPSSLLSHGRNHQFMQIPDLTIRLVFDASLLKELQLGFETPILELEPTEVVYAAKEQNLVGEDIAVWCAFLVVAASNARDIELAREALAMTVKVCRELSIPNRPSIEVAWQVLMAIRLLSHNPFVNWGKEHLRELIDLIVLRVDQDATRQSLIRVATDELMRFRQESQMPGAIVKLSNYNGVLYFPWQRWERERMITQRLARGLDALDSGQKLSTFDNRQTVLSSAFNHAKASIMQVRDKFKNQQWEQLENQCFGYWELQLLRRRLLDKM